MYIPTNSISSVEYSAFLVFVAQIVIWLEIGSVSFIGECQIHYIVLPYFLLNFVENLRISTTI